ncbi:MAG: hypothetical protein JXA82_15210 [Sedimentisphaerales bacterium]|nr:hypothetical protein [Sedimentisphaerales bacterium]
MSCGKRWIVLVMLSFVVGNIAISGSDNGERPLQKEGHTSYSSDLDAFFKEIDTAYPFLDLKDIRNDWDQSKQDLSKRIQLCKSDTEFLRIVFDAIKCLRDSHLQLTSVTIQIPMPEPEYYPLIGFMPAQDNSVVVMLSPAEYGKGIPIGTTVVSIDGVNAREYLDARGDELWREGGCPSPQRARLFAYRIPLRGSKGQMHTIVIRKGLGGATEEIQLGNNTEARGWPHVYHLPNGLTRIGRSFFYKKLSSGVGYMYLRRVDPSITEGIGQAVQAHPDVKGWIVDLRGNGGGGYDNQLIEQLKQLKRPVAGIIDAGCVSAGETLARDLRRYAQARLFGTRTAGSSSSKRTWRFPSGIASVVIPTRSRWRIDGKPIEFNGIEPDEEIEPLASDVLKGINTEIRIAESYILQQMDQKQSDS